MSKVFRTALFYTELSTWSQGTEMVTQMITYQVVEGGLEMRCLMCQAVEFCETGRQRWKHFEVVPDGPYGRCFIITCKACGHKNLRASMQPDW